MSNPPTRIAHWQAWHSVFPTCDSPHLLHPRRQCHLLVITNGMLRALLMKQSEHVERARSGESARYHDHRRQSLRGSAAGGTAITWVSLFPSPLLLVLRVAYLSLQPRIVFAYIKPLTWPRKEKGNRANHWHSLNPFSSWTFPSYILDLSGSWPLFSLSDC